MKNMWDTDEESRKMCELSLPAIKVNYEKFERFYTEKFKRTTQKYFSDSFNQVMHHFTHRLFPGELSLPAFSTSFVHTDKPCIP